MKTVEAVLAYDKNFVMGKGDGLPWTHRGDLKRFKLLTVNNSLLMGAKTYLGIAKHYVGNSGVVLPNRRLFVLGKPRGTVSEEQKVTMERRGFDAEWRLLRDEFYSKLDELNVNYQNTTPLTYFDSPTEVMDVIQSTYTTTDKLMIVGGAKVYRDFLPFCSKIHVTVINQETQGEDLVKLHTESIELLTGSGYTKESCGIEMCDGIEAQYYTLTRNHQDQGH